MRRVLVLGGTGWLGREIVRSTLAGGAEVVCLARGESGAVPAGARLVRADRRAANAYDGVLQQWDEVVEISYAPDLVGPALDALAERAAHWTLISSASVYAGNDVPDADESAAVVVPRDLTVYADAKVAAERSASARLGGRLLIARAGLIVGAGDPTDRFGYWPMRFSLPGPVLTPTTAGRSVQVIDVRDLADWVDRAGRASKTGVVDAVGEARPMEQFFRGVGSTAERVAVTDEELLALGVQHWSGPRSLPLWLPMTDAALMQRSGAAFRAMGGTCRPVEETVLGVLEDERARGIHRRRLAGLTAHEEAEVLRAVGH